MEYEETAEELIKRIVALIPDNPHVAQMDSVWDLLRVPGFKCDDINPSLAQAQFALRKAQQIHRKNQTPCPHN